MAVRVLKGVAQQKGAPAAARVAACSALLDRGWGKPTQSIEADGDIRITIRKMLGGDDDDNDPKGG